MRPLLFELPLPLASFSWFTALGLLGFAGLVTAILGHLGKSRPLVVLGAAGVVGSLVGVAAVGALRDTLGGLPIYSHGVLLAVAFAAGSASAGAFARREGMPVEDVVQASALAFAAGLLGARLAYVVENASSLFSLREVLAFNRGGLSLWGSLLGVAGAAWWLRRRRLNPLAFADLGAVAAAMGLIFGRLGCYLYGCDYGRPLRSDAPGWLKHLGTFPRWDEPPWLSGLGSPAWLAHPGPLDASVPSSLPVHPTQLYEALLAALLVVAAFVIRRTRKFYGEVCLVVASVFLIGHFDLAILRDDPERARLGPALSGVAVFGLQAVVVAASWFHGPSRVFPNLRLRTTTAAAFGIGVGWLSFLVFGSPSEAVRLTAAQWIALAALPVAAHVWACQLPRTALRASEN